VEPDVGVLLAGRDERAHPVGEDLRTSARHRAEAGIPELAEHLLVREARQGRHVVDLGGRVALEVHVGKRAIERPDRVDVEVEADVRILAVHHVDLGEAGGGVLRDGIAHEFLRRDRVGVLLLAGGGEGAELAFHAADVRLVQVQVLHEEDLVRASAEASGEVGQLAQLEEVVRLEDGEAVLEVETLTRLELLSNRRECGCLVEQCHVAQSFRSTTASARASSSSRRTAPFRLSLARVA
jgi:hypothetical protein